MIVEIITKGAELMPTLIPQEWDERTVIQLEDGTITLTFKDGRVSITQGDNPDAASIIRLAKKRLCDAIDGSTDFMTIWRELAEPSPTDRTTILKGSGAKLTALLDLLSRCYKSNGEFKKTS